LRSCSWAYALDRRPGPKPSRSPSGQQAGNPAALRSRPLLVAGALLAVLLAGALLLLTPSFLVVGLLHDAAGPPAVAKVLTAAKEQLHMTRGFQWPAGTPRPILQPTKPPSQEGVNCAGTGHHPGSRGRASSRGVQRKGADVRWRPIADPSHARGLRPVPCDYRHHALDLAAEFTRG